MIFKEKLNTKDPEEWWYETEDVFGVITLLSPAKLDKNTLDACVMSVLKANQKSLIINNTIKATYVPNEHWNEDEDNEGKVDGTE